MPAPSNDNFANAIALSTTLPANRTGDTNNDATYETGEENSFGGSALGDQSVWYTFTPTATGRYKFRVDNVTLIGNVARYYGISIYTGSAVNALTKIGTDRVLGIGQGPNKAAFTISLTSGVTYRIKVWSPIFSSETNPRTISYDLQWDAEGSGSAPANDNIANATDLGTDPADGAHTGTTRFATTEGWEGGTNPGSPSAWFKYTCSTTETQAFGLRKTGTNPDYYPYFEVWEVVNDPPTSWSDLTNYTGSSEAFAAQDASLSKALTAGKKYYIWVGNWEYDVGQGDDWTLYVGSIPQAPANDVRTALNSAPLLNYYPWYLSRSEYIASPNSSYWTQRQAGFADGTTVAATADAGEGSHGGYGPTRSVWYVLDINKAGSYKIWVESSVDCTLAIYNKPNGTLGTLIAEDDDSGTGNWPEITTTLSQGDYWVVVDSKIEGTFRLKWERIGTGTPPSNNNFANAVNISSIPFSTTGTTVNATAEADEHESVYMGGGPKDTVWYKYVASGNGTLKIKATVQSTNGGPDSGQTAVNIDLFRGTTLANLVRHPNPPAERGWFNHFDTADELEREAIYLDYANGETYYIRVQTPGGGSEDFTITIDTLSVYLDLQPSGFDAGPTVDEATVYLKLTVSGVIESHGAIVDAATIPLKLTPGATWETQGQERVDSATIYLDLVALGGECYGRFHFTGEGEADLRWEVVSDLCRWSPDDQLRWTAFVETQPGC